MKIFLGADHRGYELKEKIKEWLSDLRYDFEDMGAFKLDLYDDYPDFISRVAGKVSEDPENNKGIILGASGQGEAIVANKYDGVRAAVYYGGPEEIIKLSKEHNNSNILSLGAAFINDDIAKKMVKLWLETDFSQEERHKRRLDKISKIKK